MKKTSQIFLVTIAALLFFSPPSKAQDFAQSSFIPMADEVLPLKSRVVTLEFRHTPLRDALYAIADITGLNLILQQGVNPELPVTLSLRNIKAEQAITLILNAAGYFYTLHNNILTVRALDTRVFEFGQPPVIQTYQVDVGGDILGSAIESARDFTEGSGSSTGSTEDLRGLVTQKIVSDEVAYNFWNSVQDNLETILDIDHQRSRRPEEDPSRPFFSINRMTGTIVVSAPKEELIKAENYISKLQESLNRQVIIEARILEVQLSSGLKYGIDWEWIAEKSARTSATLSGKRFTDILKDDDPQVQVHLTRGDFSGVLSAIEEQGQVKTLSNPRINIMNGQTAILSVGRSQSFLSSLTIRRTRTAADTETDYSTQISSVLSGVMLGIVPHINEAGEVSMTITPIISELIDMKEQAIGTEGTRISLPTVDLRQLSTTVKVGNNDLIVIGGLTQTKRSKQDKQVPFVSRVPVLGYLFRQADHSDQETDIVIILRPMVKT